MDLNIGAALWMAAKAEGHVTVVAATTASRQQMHRHQLAKQTALAAAAAPPVAEPHAGNISSHSTCSSKPPSNLQSALPQTTRHTAADVGQHQGNPGDQPGLVQDACTFQDGAEAGNTSTASSPKAALHDAAASCSKAASSGGGEPVVNEQNDCTSPRGAVPGRVSPADDEQNGGMRHGWYKSAARVVLLGHGADEQHAGYGRHRTSFRNQVSPINLEQNNHLCFCLAYDGKCAPNGSTFLLNGSL